MNNISIAQETIRITAAKAFTLNGQEIALPDLDYAAAEVITPEQGAALCSAPPACTLLPEPAEITVTTEDSYAAAKRLGHALVLNFANAYNPGGGFLLGANAQEEALCRCSTLYASLKSAQAAQMYHYNRTHPAPTESDHMLFSPNVCVFRNHHCELTNEHFPVTVITAPAPNRRGTAVFASQKTIRETFERRIRIILRIAAAHGCRNLVLGAWGCGAFGNDPALVADCFKQMLAEEPMQYCFAKVCFAVYGGENSRNFRAFRDAFQ